MLVSMKEILERANQGNYAVPAPNVVTELDARAALEVAEELCSPMVLDVSFRANPDMEFLGGFLKQLADKAKIPVALHMDHGAEYEKFAQCILAIRSGFTSLMVDRSTLPFEENVRQVKEIVKIAHAVGVTVEAELGHVGLAQRLDKKTVLFTDPEDARKFVAETQVDCLAVSIGNAHGEYRGIPKIDLERLAAIKESTGRMPLVMHGSSGIADEDLRKACMGGINKVNVNHDLLKGAYEEIMAADMKENGAYKLWALIRSGYKKRLAHLIQECYGSQGKAWTAEKKGLSDVVVAVRREASSPLCLD